jgi:hypothetical protein
MPTFSISDRGLLIKRSGPAQALEDSAARRRAVVRALEILHPVVRPLALEITLGPLDPETFAVAPAESRRIASRAIPSGVANPSAFEQPAEIELVDDLTADVLLRALTPAQPGWDFATITASVTAARVTASELTIDRMPAHAVPMLVLDGEHWAVGPIDAQGYRLAPPIALRWRQEWGDVELTIEALWSLWWQTDSAELAGLRAAERALDDPGFSAQPA